ncbi:Phospholipid/glycerol acyltransferase [Macleaya cordata]|uniref:Phospholipid/glycerol acyltransferase n=1 Tax=Macleaya cordata TaxID=56857 RepID=A0A200R1Z4_MACCD|nr:Phospholipid/glycerol acyltransferase [Macleaya cordata]
MAGMAISFKTLLFFCRIVHRRLIRSPHFQHRSNWGCNSNALHLKIHRVGRAVLPKFFLEDVGFEGFEVLMRYGRKMGVSLMEDKHKGGLNLQEIFGEEKMGSEDIVGFGSFHRSLEHHYFSHCKEIYLVNEAEKNNWQNLPREKYPKPLIFHDGRLAFKPTPLATLAMFIWTPFGLLLFSFRFLVGTTLPYNISIPLLAFSGMRLIQSKPNPTSISPTKKKKPKGLLYVCNHRTLLDPIYLCGAVRKPLTAVTYSLSRLCEMVAPIRTVRLTRNREKDAEMMEKMLTEGDVVVCPEGTTCREPYLLRFSPLFAEVSDEIVPVAIDVQVSMFYGTTASGYKFLDPIFFNMNPSLTYSIKFLEKISSETSINVGMKKSRYEVANHVQRELGKALGFECTNLTRKDKYMILAGNEGIVKDAGINKSSTN